MRPNKQNRLLFFAMTAVALLCAFLAWDRYMLMSWDKHIISSVPQIYYYGQKENELSTRVHGAEAAALPSRFKKRIEIEKRNGSYYLGSHQALLLNRTIEYQPITKQGLTNRQGLHWVVFSSADRSIVIRIQGNGYLDFSEYEGFGCHPRGLFGNAIVQYRLKNNSYLFAYVTIDVYVNVIQHFYCR